MCICVCVCLCGVLASMCYTVDNNSTKCVGARMRIVMFVLT